MTLESFGSGHPTSVQVAAIERELTRLWKEAARGSHGEAEAVTRACLLNLLVLSRAGGCQERDRILAEVVQARPARVFFLEIDPALGGDALQAWISAHCTLPRAGNRQVCSEQVTMRISPGGATHLPALLSTLVASDLPSCLWLPEGLPPDPALLDRLGPLADRLIVDSLHLGIAEMELLARRSLSPGCPMLGDLNWGRLLPLQLGIAGIFDSPLMRPMIDRIDAVQTVGGPGSSAASRLLASWAGVALKRAALRRDHEEVPGAPNGKLTRLVLEASDGSRAVVESEGVTGMWTSRAELPGACPLPRRTRFRERTSAELLCDELDRSGRDSLYEAALTRATAAD